MKSIVQSKDITGIEVTNITKHGLWLLTRDHELFISFKEFPQFQDASVSKIMKIEQPNPTVLHWPDLGIELAVESVRCFPLVSPTPAQQHVLVDRPRQDLSRARGSENHGIDSNQQCSTLPTVAAREAFPTMAVYLSVQPLVLFLF